MIDYLPIYFLLFIITGTILIFASHSDIKSRTIPLKYWYPIVYFVLPISFIPIIDHIWNGVININDPMQSIPIIYTIFSIFVLIFIAYMGKIGCADVIAIISILIMVLPINVNLPLTYLLLLIILSIIIIIVWKLFNKKETIPYIIPISLSYFIMFILYFAYGFTAISLV